MVTSAIKYRVFSFRRREAIITVNKNDVLLMPNPHWYKYKCVMAQCTLTWYSTNRLLLYVDIDWGQSGSSKRFRTLMNLMLMFFRAIRNMKQIWRPPVQVFGGHRTQIPNIIHETPDKYHHRIIFPWAKWSNLHMEQQPVTDLGRVMA